MPLPGIVTWELGVLNDEEAVRSITGYAMDSCGTGGDAGEGNGGTFLALFTDKFDTFELGPPLQYLDNDPSNTSGLDEWFSSFEGNIDYEIKDLRCQGNNEFGFCYSLYHITGKKTDGSKVDMWCRQTLGLIRINGEWQIQHSHLSVPMYMDKDAKAAIDLKP